MSIQLFFFSFLFSDLFVLLILLSVSFLVVVISLLPRFLRSLLVIVLMLSWILVSPLPPFLNIYSLPTSSLECKALFPRPLVKVFLLSNSPEYLTRGTAQVFVPLIRFLQCSLVSRSFRVLQRYSFYLFMYFFHLRLFDGFRFQYPQVFVSFLFS